MKKFLVVALLAVMVAFAWMPAFDTEANAKVDAGLQRAIATYATARLLNGIISVAQGTQIAAAPAGIGMTLSPGEILDPLNDLVEQFSEVMLVAIVAFGVEKMLLAIGASWAISLILSVVAGLWAFLYLFGASVPRWLARIFLVLLVTRFAMPVSLMATDLVFEQFMASGYQESLTTIKTMQGETGNLKAIDMEEKHGLWERLKGATVDALAETRAKLENLKQSAENAVDHVIDLMVIFVLETIILPIFFLWALFHVGRGVFEPRTDGKSG
jgi:hypothetical protein